MGDHLEDFFCRTGKSWSEEEYETVVLWLHEDERLRRILLWGVLYLAAAGKSATWHDAQDAWNTFYIETYGLLLITRSYDPEKGNHPEKAECFLRYVLKCFKNSCRRGRSQSQNLQDGLSIEWPDVPIHIDVLHGHSYVGPDEAIEIEEIVKAIERLLNRLKPRHRQVVIMHYFDGSSIEKIAEELDESVSNVKVMLHRARQLLRKKISRDKSLSELLGRKFVG